MLASVDLTLAHYANIVGLAICFAVVLASKWRFKERNRTNTILIMLLLCVVVSCIMHSVAVVVDGMPGAVMRKLVYISNTWLFLANIISGFLWIMFMEENIHGTNSVLHFRVMQLVSLIGFVMLFINFYIPVVFAVNANNVYSRRHLFYLYMITELWFLVDATSMYMKAKYLKGVITVFPVWTYIIPILIGMFLQLLIYGVSLIWPCSAISVAILFFSFNSEDRYRDILTGVYNKTYFDVLHKMFLKEKNHDYIALRVNVLGIAAMGSVLGKDRENEARVDMAKTLSKAVKPIGLLTQYDMDTYVVFFSGKNADCMEEYMHKIIDELGILNKEKKMYYSLSVEMDYETFEADKEDIEKVVIDLGARLQERAVNQL